MINYNYLDVELELDEAELSRWIDSIATTEGNSIGEINYIFCTDEYLHDLNVKYLNHDTLTDVIGFDNSVGKKLHGDIFISTERVAENATEFKVDFLEELHRVIAHGLLHFCGYSDKTTRDTEMMRAREEFHLSTRL